MKTYAGLRRTMIALLAFVGVMAVLHSEASAKVYLDIKDARRIAHRFSNEVFKAFTGEDGVFDTQIAFVRRERDHSQIFIADYDGANAAPVLSGKEINL